MSIDEVIERICCAIDNYQGDKISLYEALLDEADVWQEELEKLWEEEE